MNDAGTTTGELVCEVRVTGAAAARVPRILAAADALRAADAALLAATQRCDAAHEAVLARLRWQGERQRQRQGFVGVAAEWLDDSPESAAIARERGEARSARGDAEAAVSAAVRRLTAAARGER